MRFPAVIVLALSIFLTGCGYHVGEIRPTPMRSVRTLAVPTFKNKTYKVRIESLFADTLVKHLQSDGTYEIVSTDKADAILYCTVSAIEQRSLRSVQNNVLATSEFGMRVTADYEVQDRVTGAILMRGRAPGNATFFSGNDLQTIERQAISDAAADLAKNITAEVTEGW
ncbi:MAG: LPS assembly lipoprotein LptE [Verrucomicrobiae bacterium]